MLVLHIGPHKTATTYLQANFTRQRAELLKHGWLYPTTGVRTAIAHHDIADAARLIAEGAGPAFDDMRAAARKAKARNLDVLLSAESFRRWNARQVGALANVFDCPAPRLVYVLRDPMSVLRSMWAQSVKLGGTEDLPRFLARHMRDPKRSRLLNPLRDIGLHLKHERSDLTILLYDELARRKADIFTVFMDEALGVRDARPTAEIANARPELEMTEFLRLVSASGGYASHEGRVDVGDAVRNLFSPNERRSIVEIIRERGAGALRTIKVMRETPYYAELEITLKEALGKQFRPQPAPDRLFPTHSETWSCYNGDALMNVPEVRRLVERASRRLNRWDPRVAVLNQGFRALMAGRRLRNLVSSRIG